MVKQKKDGSLVERDEFFQNDFLEDDEEGFKNYMEK